MKVLVTGHHGYIGSVTVPALLDAGHDVVGLDTFLYRGCDLFEPESRVPELFVDVRDVGPRELAGFDAVVHLAALSNDPLGDFDAELTREINFRATVRVAEAARQAGVQRFIFASSCSMYGVSDTTTPVDETAELAPFTAYAESKVLSESALRELADERFSPIYMRNATVYGVSPRLRLDIVLNNLTAWAHTTGQVRILSDGSPWRPLVHVRDVARATVALLEAPREAVHNEAFNIGSDADNHQVRDLAGMVREAVPGSEVHFAGTGDPDPRSYRVDFSKLGVHLPHFRCEWDAERGAGELYDAYRRASLTLEEFEGDRFVRLRRLRRLLDDRRLDDGLRWASATTAS